MGITWQVSVATNIAGFRIEWIASSLSWLKEPLIQIVFGFAVSFLPAGCDYNAYTIVQFANDTVEKLKS